MPFKRRFKDKYAGSSPENASVVRTLFDLLLIFSIEKDSSFVDEEAILLFFLLFLFVSSCWRSERDGRPAHVAHPGSSRTSQADLHLQSQHFLLQVSLTWRMGLASCLQRIYRFILPFVTIFLSHFFFK